MLIYQRPKEGVVVAAEAVDVEDLEVEAGLESGMVVSYFNFFLRD